MLLDSLHPCSTTCEGILVISSSPWEDVKIFLTSASSGINAIWPTREKCLQPKVWLPGCPYHVVTAHMVQLQPASNIRSDNYYNTQWTLTYINCGMYVCRTLPILCPSGRKWTKVPSRTCWSSHTPSWDQIVLETVGIYGDIRMDRR